MQSKTLTFLLLLSAIAIMLFILGEVAEQTVISSGAKIVAIGIAAFIGSLFARYVDLDKGI